jgi:hypothetical protein
MVTFSRIFARNSATQEILFHIFFELSNNLITILQSFYFLKSATSCLRKRANKKSTKCRISPLMIAFPRSKLSVWELFISCLQSQEVGVGFNTKVREIEDNALISPNLSPLIPVHLTPNASEVRGLHITPELESNSATLGRKCI